MRWKIDCGNIFKQDCPRLIYAGGFWSCPDDCPQYVKRILRSGWTVGTEDCKSHKERLETGGVNMDSHNDRVEVDEYSRVR